MALEDIPPIAVSGTTTTTTTTDIQNENGVNGNRLNIENLRESDVYDRQIRLWGAEAQKRLQNSRVLLVGLNGIFVEVCKNLVLAGINVTIQDTTVVTEMDLGANFFLRHDSIGQNKAIACLPYVQELNKFGKPDCITEDIMSFSDDFFDNYDVICITDCDPKTVLYLDNICRRKDIKFIYAETFGLHAFFILDLGHHEFLLDDNKTAKTLDYPSMEVVFTTKWDTLRDRWGPVSKSFIYGRLLGMFRDKFGRKPVIDHDFKDLKDLTIVAFETNGLIMSDFMNDDDIEELITFSGTDFPPVCAVAGGLLGQELLSVISKKGDPAFNVFALDGLSNEGKVFAVPKQSK